MLTILLHTYVHQLSYFSLRPCWPPEFEVIPALAKVNLLSIHVRYSDLQFTMGFNLFQYQCWLVVWTMFYFSIYWE